MKPIYTIWCAIAISVISVTGISAQISLSGEIRPRTETSHGYGTLAGEGQDASTFTTQRTRINFNYASENLKTGIVLQDVRLWGSQPQLVSNEDFAVSAHEAWAEVLFNNEFSLKAGRQELVYDNHRILGNVGWAQQGRSHDVALFKYSGSLNVHAGLAYNENSNRSNNFYTGPDAYKAMQFIWLNKKIDPVEISLLFLNNGIPVSSYSSGNEPALIDQEINYSQTIGSYLSANILSANVNGSFYYQTGKTASDMDIAAYQAMIEVQKKFGNKLSLLAGYEILSGTAYNDTENKSFTPLYGTNHKFNGFMDYFYVGNHANSVGLKDMYLQAGYQAGPVDLKAFAHFFSAHAEIGPNADKNLGTELDLVAAIPLNKEANLSAGYSRMFATSSLELLKGGNSNEPQYWGWVMLSVKPVFFKE